MMKRGQLSLINLVYFGVALVPVSLVIAAIMSAFISDFATTQNFSALSTVILDFIVPIYLLGLVITFLIYVVPQFTRPQG